MAALFPLQEELELEHDADRHTEVLAAGAAIVVQHHPVSGATDRHIAAHVDVNATASQHRQTINGTTYVGGRETSSTDQYMYERRVGFVRAQRQLWTECVGVIVDTHTLNALVPGTEIGRNPKVVVEIPCGPKVQAVEVSSTFQTCVLIPAEELRLRMVRLSC